MSIASKLQTVSQNVPEVFAAGKKSEYDAFWNAYQKNGKRTSYLLGFAGDGWTEDTFKPKYNIPVTYGYMTFRNSAIDVDLVEHCGELGISITFDGCTDFNQTFFNSKFTRIGEINTLSASTLASTFASAAVRKIDKLILKSDGSQTFTSTFSGCKNLTELEIEGTVGNSISFADSPLNAKSVVSVVNALSGTAQSKTATFSKDAMNSANWTDTEYDSWEALAATKNNWTFKLS